MTATTRHWRAALADGKGARNRRTRPKSWMIGGDSLVSVDGTAL